MVIVRRIGGGFLASALVFSGSHAAPARTAEDKRQWPSTKFSGIWQKAGSPGCALGVYRDGKMIYPRDMALQILRRMWPVTPQSVFDIGPHPNSSLRRASAFWKSRANSPSMTTSENTFLSFRITGKKSRCFIS